MGDRDPLPALLRPGMKLTICFDDVSLPLPQMQAPDVRQMVIETVLDMAAEAGVDDVVLVAALALHRRMTEAELRHALGDRVYDAFAPHGLLTQHDAEDPDNLIHLGQTDQGEDVEINKRAATSDLLVYVNINLVAMDGGHKSVATGLASYRSLRHHHNPHTMVHSKSFMDQPASELHSANWRMGRLIADAGVKVFQIETTLNNDTFPSNFSFLQKREWEWSLRDRATYATTSAALAKVPPRLSRQIFHGIRAPHALTSVQAGEVEAVHALTTQHVWEQQGVDVEGQTDILTMGLPYICPYNVNSIMNPILVACLGLGYFFNMYRGRPLVREGGVLIMRHPTRPEFHPGHHPSYIDFYEQVLTQTMDPAAMHKQFEESFATDPWYIHLYRTGHAYHGVHPFYMWYWCAHALEHLGRVIVVGGDPKAVRRLGFSPASSLDDALEIASRRGRALPHPHPHAQPAHLHVGRALMALSALQRQGARGPLPLRGTVVAHLARAARPRTQGGARLRPRLVAALPGAPGPGRGHGQRHQAGGPAAGPGHRPRARAPGAHRRAGDLRRQPRQPHRHAAAPDHAAGRLPSPHRGGGRVGLLLRPHLEVGPLGLRAGRHPHRAHPGQPQVGRHGGRAARGRAGTWSSSPRAGARPTGGPNPSAAAPPTWPGAPGARWSRCTCTAPATCCPRSPTTRGCPRAARAPRRARGAGCAAPPSSCSSVPP